jgi:dipeptidyl-peptidase-4
MLTRPGPVYNPAPFPAIQMQLHELTPERYVETGRLNFGLPRAVRVSRDGRRVALLRAPDPRSPDQELWLMTRDAAGGWRERRIAGHAGLATEGEEARAMRERTRELATGITAFTADERLDRLIFAAGGLWTWTDAEGLHALEVPSGAEEPLLGPDGRLLACLVDRTMTVVPVDDPSTPVATLAPAHEHEVLGRPDFIAAEELGRFTGMWWDPGGRYLLVQRTDERPLPMWTLPNPGNPAAAPVTVRYPAAGGENARVALALLDTSTGDARPVVWDAERLPYLVRAVWTRGGGLTLDAQSRDQRVLVTYRVEPASGAVEEVARLWDPLWVEPGNGTRDHAPDGRLCRLVDDDGERVLRLGERRIGAPGGAPIVDVAGTCADGLLAEVAVSRVDRRLLLVGWDGEQAWLSAERGTAAGWGGGGTVVVEQRDADRSRPVTTIRDLPRDGQRHAAAITSRAEPLDWDEAVEFHDLDDGGSSAALLLPLGYDAERDGPLPVLLDPYGGPGFARVVRDRRAFAYARRLAEPGYAVLAIDGVGAPARSPAWERRIAGDFTVTLDSQVRGLEEMAERRPGVLDLAAVGIRGWSFGGYLAALAAIRRPDLFRAAAVGAPVSDWTLYDTHYTERFLGHGPGFADAAERSGLARAIAEAVARGARPSPMLILHGYEDDNVVAAHAVRLSEALTAHGVPHASILLSSLTHVARSSVFAQVLHIELEFLDAHLRLGAAAAPAQVQACSPRAAQ